MAITVVSSNSGFVNEGGTTISVSITPSGSDRLLMAFVFQDYGGIPSGCVFNTTEIMSEVGNKTFVSVGGNLCLTAYKLVAPTTTTANVVASGLLAGVPKVMIVYALTGVNQTDSTGTAATNSGTGTVQSESISSNTGELCIDGVALRNNPPGIITEGTGQGNVVQVVSTASGEYYNARMLVSTLTGASSSTSMSSTLAASRNWVSVGVAIKPSEFFIYDSYIRNLASVPNIIVPFSVWATKPAEYDITDCYPGEYWQKGFRLNDQYRTVKPIVGYTAKMQIRDKVGGAVYCELTTENGRISIMGDWISLKLSDGDTEALTFKEGVYDLFLTGGGVTNFVVGGKWIPRKVK